MPKSWVALAVFLCSAPARAATWYVAVDGSGSRDGTSWEDAATDPDSLRFKIEPGDTVYVGPGEFKMRSLDICDLTIIGAGSSVSTLAPHVHYDYDKPLFVCEQGTLSLARVSFRPGAASFRSLALIGSAAQIELLDVETRLSLEVRGRADLQNSDFRSVTITVDDQASLTGGGLTLTDVVFELRSNGSARVTDSVGDQWRIRAIGGGSLDLRRNIFSNNGGTVVETQARTLRFEANLVEHAPKGLSLALNPHLQSGLTSTIIDNVFDDVGDPIRIAGPGVHYVIHNTFLAPDEEFFPLAPPTLLGCDADTEPRVDVIFRNNASKGFPALIVADGSCQVGLGGNAWTFSGGAVALTGALPSSTDLPDTRFRLNDRYRPRLDSPLVGAAPQPGSTVGLLSDFHGRLRSWPATIGAVERPLKKLTLEPATAPDGRRSE